MNAPSCNIVTPQDPAEVRRVGDAFSAGAVPHAGPRWLTPHAYRDSFVIDRPLSACWRWLNDPATFTEGQIWPYRVEFVSPDPEVGSGFQIGVLNWHHGPGLDCAGVIADIQPMQYRDLKYFYGSFVISPRFIRPTRLQFWTNAATDNATEVRLQLDSLVRRSWSPKWTWLQSQFWRRFPKWMAKAIPTD